jgi:hypothetical protein
VKRHSDCAGINQKKPNRIAARNPNAAQVAM